MDSTVENLSAFPVRSLVAVDNGNKKLGWLARLRTRWRLICAALLLVLVCVVAGLSFWLQRRYAVADTMDLPLREFSNSEYPEDPAFRSSHFGQYFGRKLKLVRRSRGFFDFVLEPTDPRTATVIFHNIDVRLMTPSEPAWTRGDADLERIALTDRQWNRQQVSFDGHSPHVEVVGGDGFEKTNLASAELAKNCLNAGLWEVLLFVHENEHKALYYHGWFTFPLGHYKDLFEENTGLSYWQHWYKLEHWSDPAGTPVRLATLRRVESEREVPVTFDPSEPILVSGEQTNKRRTTEGRNILTWGDFYDGPMVRFATFTPPGRYDLNRLWKNEYGRLARLNKAILRDIVSPASSRPLQELELIFASRDMGEKVRFIVSGFDLARLPQLPPGRYSEGLYMPMGIGVPPFFQDYTELQKNPPDKSPYLSLMLDSSDHWINHHAVAVDGPVLHRDAKDANLLHAYLLSYERHTLIGHYVIQTQIFR
jgi:hypothetical protein